MPNPLVGVIYHWLGGAASASFYVPYRGVRGWNWEILWLTGGLVSWLVMPWLFAGALTRDLVGVLLRTPPAVSGLCVLFGMLWGFGGLTYGLTMRYLGLSLGMAVVLGLCTVFGTLLPPIVTGSVAATLIDRPGGRAVLLGLAVTLAGIVVVARAGARRDRAARAGAADAARDARFGRGVATAIFSGVMSSCFAFGLAAGGPVRALSAAAGTDALWTGLPVLCLVMAGGLATNAGWCAILIAKHRSAGQWFGRAGADRLARNYALAAVGGALWYLQFFFYSMGESQMGRFGFTSWTLHMASIIIFGFLWGLSLGEWRGAAAPVRRTAYAGVGALVLATGIIGYGNMLS